MTVDAMKARSAIVTRTREFFLGRDYIETETPILSPSLIPESCLEAFATEFVHPYRKGFPLYLVPSPEIWMKRIIAATGRSVFQLCKAFRNAESIGPIHNPEFTMLEYYTVGGTTGTNIALTEELFDALLLPETPASVRPPFRRMTMAEAFAGLAGLDLAKLMERGAMVEAARSKGLVLPDGSTWEDAFNIVFLSCVEPRLPVDKPLALDEYPAGIECLAKEIPGSGCRERWELYIGGVEIANCFSELADEAEVAAYFSSQERKKKDSLVHHAVDRGYPSLFRDFPQCSGVAIGFDRLVMALTGAGKIQDVINFPFGDFLPPGE